jgi:uncharacterized protein involved in exopolysaccharide biosynthesis
MFVSFVAVVAMTCLFALLRTPLYQSQMTILVNLERADPVVTTDPNILPRYVAGLSDEDVNSELELVRSRDLLEEVVVTCGLHTLKRATPWAIATRWLRVILGGRGEKNEKLAIAKAVLDLRKNLLVELVPKSTLIRVSYTSPDPELSARVLNTLADLYLKKHLAVRRPPGALDFFTQEAEKRRADLASAERRLASFGRDHNVASVQAEKEATLKKLTELEVGLHDTEASIEVTKRHIQSLAAQMGRIPSRLTTQVRKSSSRPPDQLQSTLLTLELKRTELLSVFKPDYPEVKEVEKQIADTRAAMAASQQDAVVEETTDRDPTYEWLRSESEKARLDLVDLETRARTDTQMIAEYQAKARQLTQMEIDEQDLARNAKLTEENYVVYEKKQEEARISDALDRQRIVNVSIAERPSVPVLPSTLPTPLVLLLGTVLAGLLSGGLAFGADRVDASLRTPHEVEQVLDIPFVAAIPERVD